MYLCANIQCSTGSKFLLTNQSFWRSKTFASFYFFFNSKEEYLNQLFAYWVVTGTSNLIAMVNQIQDPARRFFALGKMIEENLENEFFYFQLKLYCRENEHGDDSSKKLTISVYLLVQNSSKMPGNLMNRLNNREE